MDENEPIIYGTAPLAEHAKEVIDEWKKHMN